jgi:hypothetical protein
MQDEIKCSKCADGRDKDMDTCNRCNSENDLFVLNSFIKNEINEISNDIQRELFDAIKKYPLGFHSNHEALGTIREEYKEFENEIFKEKYFYKATDNMINEAIQCAAMYIRFILEMRKGD